MSDLQAVGSCLPEDAGLKEQAVPADLAAHSQARALGLQPSPVLLLRYFPPAPPPHRFPDLGTSPFFNPSKSMPGAKQIHILTSSNHTSGLMLTPHGSARGLLLQKKAEQKRKDEGWEAAARLSDFPVRPYTLPGAAPP